LPAFAAYTDCELLAAIRNDDEKAFAELFKRHWRRVHSMAYSKVRSKEVTEEIVQDLFISLWDKRGSLSINNLPSYLFTAVKHRALNHIESQIVHKKYWDYSKNYIPRLEYATETIVEFNELMEAIEEGMDQQPAERRVSHARIQKFIGVSFLSKMKMAWPGVFKEVDDEVADQDQESG